MVSTKISCAGSYALSFSAVDIVIGKLPIKLLDRTLDIERYAPLLEETETIQRLEINGLPSQLSNDLRQMYQEGLRGSASLSQSSKPQGQHAITVQSYTSITSCINTKDIYAYGGKTP